MKDSTDQKEIENDESETSVVFIDSVAPPEPAEPPADVPPEISMTAAPSLAKRSSYAQWNIAIYEGKRISSFLCAIISIELYIIGKLAYALVLMHPLLGQLKHRCGS